MRHQRRVATLAVGLLPSAMGTPPSLASLVALARCPDLAAPPAAPALFAAIALTAVATGADRKHRTAAWFAALTLPKALNLIVRRPHLINITLAPG